MLKKMMLKLSHIKIAININMIKEDPITFQSIFFQSILKHIGFNNSFENIIEIFPPPIIIVEIWRYQDQNKRCFNFDNFCVKVKKTKLQYRCLGTFIHTFDHFKTVVFENDSMILLDGELVANLTSSNGQFNKAFLNKLKYKICILNRFCEFFN